MTKTFQGGCVVNPEQMQIVPASLETEAIFPGSLGGVKSPARPYGRLKREQC